MWQRLRAWLLWFPPSGDTHADERARFLSALLIASLTLCPPIGMGLLWWANPQDPWGTRTAHAVLGVALLLPLAYLLNRRGMRKGAGLVLVGAAIVSTGWAATGHPDILVFATVESLLALALFPLPLAAAISVVPLLLHPLIYALGSWPASAFVLPFCVNATFVSLAVVVRLHNVRLARLRLQEVQRREQWFATTLGSIGDAVLTVDAAEAITFMNPVAERLTGWPVQEAMGKHVRTVFDICNEHTGEAAEIPTQKVLRSGAVVGLANHTVLQSRDGSRCPIADSGAPIVDAKGTIHGVVLVFRDVSAEHLMQARLRHSQRLDALGQLAGGVAHDFNNLLTAIGGGLDLVLLDLPEQHGVRAELDVVRDATRRAVGLTGQLLAFSRRQIMQRKPVELSVQVSAAQQLLQRLLREDVTVVMETHPDAGWIWVDPVQFEQVLLNLAINAADAMPQGGTLTLATSSVVVTAEEPLPPLPPGRYGRLSVKDTGVGMEPQVLEHVFEPFFTTKQADRGSGLGLATVYGIVQQSDGAVLVQSQQGVGSTFDIYIPATQDRPAVTPAPQEPTPLSGIRSLTVFIVEDNPMVRQLAVRAVSQLGCRVLEAASGSEALERLDAEQADVDVLVTDVVMPGMGGPQVAKAFRARFPNLRVVFMSGYADAATARDGVGDVDGVFLPKPFSPAQLQAMVQQEGIEGSRRR